MIIIGATIIIIVLTKIGIVYCYVQRVRCSDVLKCHLPLFASTAQQVGMQNFASEIRTPILIVGIRTKEHNLNSLCTLVLANFVL